LLVGATGIAIMTAVAYYRSWSKRVEKQPHGHPGPPVTDKADGSQPGISQIASHYRASPKSVI
jgi:hypothetical protein